MDVGMNAALGALRAGPWLKAQESGPAVSSSV